ncbi:MAG: NAD(P)-binding domain-containing protein, partial [Acidimicrobiales bacterium]|nr:NAD(P)-binding domain-containing protein [Acidimicrobiales bacterium]
MANIYYEKDVDRSAIAERKVAILGYGSQGHAHALNLKEAGGDVCVGLRDGSSSAAQAAAAGLCVRSRSGAWAWGGVFMVRRPAPPP